MTDLVAFLRARLNEDEAMAMAATPGPWWAVQGKHEDDGKLRLVKASDPAYPTEDPIYAGSAQRVAWSVTSDPDEGEQANLRHIARHDPARVLREVEAKRAILGLHRPEWHDFINADGDDRTSSDCAECSTHGLPDRWPCPTLRHLAAVYGGHPDYDPAWAPAGTG